MFSHLETYFSARKHWGILLLRFFVGGRLFYGVIDNIVSWQDMIKFSEFLEQNGFPTPMISAIASVYIQFFGSILIILGYKIRWASIILAINFLVALIFFHLRIGDTVEGMTAALAMFFGCLTFIFTGAEKVSVDSHF